MSWPSSWCPPGRCPRSGVGSADEQLSAHTGRQVQQVTASLKPSGHQSATDDRGLVVGHCTVSPPWTSCRGCPWPCRSPSGPPGRRHCRCGRSERVDGIVVGRRRCRPVDQGLSLAGVRGLRMLAGIPEMVGSSSSVTVTVKRRSRCCVDVRGRVVPSWCPPCRVPAAVVQRTADGTVVRGGRGRPGHNSTAVAGIAGVVRSPGCHR